MMDKINNDKLFTLAPCLLLLLVIFTACAYVPQEQSVTAAIRLEGLDQEAPEGMLGAAPANVIGVSVRVFGPNMPDIFTFLPNAPDSIELLVPAGPTRHFEVYVYISPDSPRAVLSYKGIKTVDLDPLGLTEINIPMAAYETKLVIADGFFSPYGRLVQINGMDGANWLTDTTVIHPSDVDFDTAGNIIISSDDTTSGGVYRFPDFLNPSGSRLITTSEIHSLAVDRYRKIIYFATTTQLYKSDYAGGTGTSIAVSGLTDIHGMDVAENGLLYVVGNYQFNKRVVRLDPVNGNVLNSFIIAVTPADPFLDNDNDVVVKDFLVFVSNRDTGQILRFTPNLIFTGSFGILVPTGTNNTPGYFYGPTKFVAVRNKNIVVIDDGDYNSTGDRLVSFNEIFGFWNTFGSRGSGADQFQFYRC